MMEKEDASIRTEHDLYRRLLRMLCKSHGGRVIIPHSYVDNGAASLNVKDHHDGWLLTLE